MPSAHSGHVSDVSIRSTSLRPRPSLRICELDGHLVTEARVYIDTSHCDIDTSACVRLLIELCMLRVYILL